MKIGFTGTQLGCTEAQRLQLAAVLYDLVISDDDLTTDLHHGDCVGADVDAHSISRQLNMYVVGHPPSDARKRAFCVFDEERVARPYLERNHDIIDETRHLLACPSSAEVVRSGTWATIRYARQLHRPITIIYADGNLAVENQPTTERSD